MENKCLMLQGTGSTVGKSLLTAALCRIFKQDGFKVAPFKSQNMALNSFITAEGEEMGRAQVVQAEASGLLPSALMNPILLKPTADTFAQVVIKGRVYKNMSAAEYQAFKPALKEMVAEIYNKLEEQNDIIVIEGAGSPAEINLKENDLVNMGMAEIADAPVILIGDIDKGGVFAALAGTMLLLTEEERKRVKGVIINKFRGDLEILRPGLRMLEDIIKIPVLGVIPYMELNIDDEDSVTEEFRRREHDPKREITIEVIHFPYMSNFTDFNVLRHFSDVSLRYVNPGESLQDPDILILPGSKNTLKDLLYLRESGLDKQIAAHHEKGKLLIGICGGYQILGQELSDPYHTESGLGFSLGLGLLDMHTVFEKEKVTTQVEACIIDDKFPFIQGLAAETIEGYEIHMGVSSPGPGVLPLIAVHSRLGQKIVVTDGVINPAGTVFGTYIHGIFDNTAFTRKLLNNVRQKKGLLPLEEIPPALKELKEREYDRLAACVREHLDMAWIYENTLGKRIR